MSTALAHVTEFKFTQIEIVVDNEALNQQCHKGESWKKVVKFSNFTTLRHLSNFVRLPKILRVQRKGNITL